MIWQSSNLLVLAALISASTTILPEAAANGLPNSPEILSIQQTTQAQTPKDSFHPRRSRSESPSKLPPWASNHTPASLDRNLHDKFAQVLMIHNTPPATPLAATSPSEPINDVDDDDGEAPRTDQSHRPVPTKMLMLRYSKLADVPIPSATGTRGHLARHSSTPSVPDHSDIPTWDAMADCSMTQGSQRDWMQRTEVQFIGVLTVFVSLALLVEGFSYLWRTCCRRRALPGGRHGVALHGDEKPLRALRGDIESRP